MLAAHLADHDTIGQWMAHHLAELVVAAQNDATTTVEQRQQIVEIILKVWAHRRYYPGRAPMQEFADVFVALSRLGDDSTWKFSRLFNTDTEPPDPSTSGLPLVTIAAELERLVRETLIRLIWLAAQEAKEKNQEWVEAADKVASNLESEVTQALWRLRRRAAHRRLLLEEGGPSSAAVTTTEAPTEDNSADGTAEGAPEALVEGATGNDTVVSDVEEAGDSFDEDYDDESDQLSSINHAKRLREMANLLNKVADALAVHPSATT